MTLMQHILSCFIALAFSAFALIIASQLHYFKRLEIKKSRFLEPNILDCIQIFLLFLISQFLILPVALYGLFIKGNEEVKLNPELMGWINLLAIVCMALILGIFLYFKKEQMKALFYSTKPIYDAGIGFLSWPIAFACASCLSQIIMLILTGILGFPLEDQTAVTQMKRSLHYPELFIPTVFAVVIVVPIMEEILFRGFLQTSLKKLMSPLEAITASAMLFAFFHFSFAQGLNNINILGALFILALFLGYVRERQGNLIPSIALHSIFNGISIGMIVLN